MKVLGEARRRRARLGQQDPRPRSPDHRRDAQRLPDHGARRAARRQPDPVDRQRRWRTAQTREEWKGFAETNKILGTTAPIPIDGVCVRVGAMRCHSQALTIKLTQDVPLDEIADVIGRANEWVRVVAERQGVDAGRAVAGRGVRHAAPCPIGRLRKMQHRARRTSRPSRSAISCCGARPNRCAACCASWRSRRSLVMADRFNILLVGHGRLGQLIAAAAPTGRRHRRRHHRRHQHRRSRRPRPLARRRRRHRRQRAGGLRRQPAGAVRARLQPGGRHHRLAGARRRGAAAASPTPASAPSSPPTSRSAPR